MPRSTRQPAGASALLLLAGVQVAEVAQRALQRFVHGHLRRGMLSHGWIIMRDEGQLIINWEQLPGRALCRLGPQVQLAPPRGSQSTQLHTHNKPARPTFGT